MIHILGDGPYAREVVSQITRPELTKFITDDAGCIPESLAIGIASPLIKKRVIEMFYDHLPTCVFLSTTGNVVISNSRTQTARCLNIGALTSIGFNVVFGDFVSVCANVTIGHDIRIMRYSTIAPGVVISGNVHIGEGSFIGAGAVIKDGIIIGDNAVVGCGAVVIEDVRSNHMVVGNPAKFLKLSQ